MPVKDFYKVFPRLERSAHRETSKPDMNYNCMGWALGDKTKWWEPFGVIVPAPPPEYYWPAGIPNQNSVQAYAQALEEQGFQSCDSPDLERGLQKVALYTQGGEVCHVARQLPNGRWTSKLGRAEDIEHTLDALRGYGPLAYGDPTHYFARPNPRR